MMSHGTWGDIPTEEHVYIDVVMNATLQIVYRKWTDLVVAVSWFCLASHTVEGQISFRSRAIWQLDVTLMKSSGLMSGLSWTARTSFFQHDNAWPHTARITRDFITMNNVQVLNWPSWSPDLNPIEHLLDELDRRVRQRDPQPQTLPAMLVALGAEYQLIPRHFIWNLVQSMGSRCQATIDANGGHTRYWLLCDLDLGTFIFLSTIFPKL